MTCSGRRLALVLITALAIATLGSHGVSSWLKIKTTAAEAFTIGKPNGNPPAYLAGSSLASYGIFWEQISTQLDVEIKTWGCAGGSPYEFEQFQKQVPEARTAFIVVSTYDLDEALTCDYHANIVPIGQTVRTLEAVHADWNHSERALKQYPMTWLRTLFPTLGRSRGLMGAMLIKVQDLVKQSSRTPETMAGPTIKFGSGTTHDEYARQKLSDWTKSKVINKIVAMDVEFQGGHSFNGPKRLAFERMLQYAAQRGRTIVIVMPVSHAYTDQFISQPLAREFEAELAWAQHAVPRVQWLRLDELPGLASDENYCDLVHLNVFGKQIATAALQAWLKQPSPQP